MRGHCIITLRFSRRRFRARPASVREQGQEDCEQQPAKREYRIDIHALGRRKILARGDNGHHGEIARPVLPEVIEHRGYHEEADSEHDRLLPTVDEARKAGHHVRDYEHTYKAQHEEHGKIPAECDIQGEAREHFDIADRRREKIVPQKVRRLDPLAQVDERPDSERFDEQHGVLREEDRSPAARGSAEYALRARLPLECEDGRYAEYQERHCDKSVPLVDGADLFAEDIRELRLIEHPSLIAALFRLFGGGRDIRLDPVHARLEFAVDARMQFELLPCVGEIFIRLIVYGALYLGDILLVNVAYLLIVFIAPEIELGAEIRARGEEYDRAAQYEQLVAFHDGKREMPAEEIAESVPNEYEAAEKVFIAVGIALYLDTDDGVEQCNAKYHHQPNEQSGRADGQPEEVHVYVL